MPDRKQTELRERALRQARNRRVGTFSFRLLLEYLAHLMRHF